MCFATVPIVDTWYGSKEFHSVFVTVEAELSVRHGAVRDEAGGRHTVGADVTVDSYDATRTTCRHTCYRLLVR